MNKSTHAPKNYTLLRPPAAPEGKVVATLNGGPNVAGQGSTPEQAVDALVGYLQELANQPRPDLDPDDLRAAGWVPLGEVETNDSAALESACADVWRLKKERDLLDAQLSTRIDEVVNLRRQLAALRAVSEKP